MNTLFLFRTRILWPVLAVALFLSCAVNPVTGKRELMLMSESQERQLGRQTDADVRLTYGLYPDPPLADYISGMGKRLAALSHRPNLDYQFRLLDSPVVNAFAVPGGYVYITRGILAYLNSEAELAGVMGHEIGHVAARHSATQYSKAQLVQLGLGLGMMLSEDFRKYAGLAQFGVGLLFLRFSRDNERQADALGVEYASKAGYDARQMANFFRTLQRMTPAESRSGLPDWFSTHPNPADRVAAIQKMAGEWRAKLGKRALVVARARYLRQIDGLVFGDDPRQGFVERHVFYHPRLRFRFRVPAGWKLNNTAAQVQILSPDGKGALIFTLASEADPATAADAFLQRSKAVAQSRRSLKVGPFPAVRLVSRINSPEGNLTVLSYFIRKQKQVYVFHGFAAPELFAGFRADFQRTCQGFRALTDPKILAVRPDRIHIQQVAKAGRLAEVLGRLGIRDAAEQQKLALLNGMELSERLPAGRFIKVVQKNR